MELARKLVVDPPDTSADTPVGVQKYLAWVFQNVFSVAKGITYKHIMMEMELSTLGRQLDSFLFEKTFASHPRGLNSKTNVRESKYLTHSGVLTPLEVVLRVTGAPCKQDEDNQLIR